MSAVNIILLVVFSICSYLLGSINWALIISKRKNHDIRNMGSGNPGTLNMSRNFGLGFGLLTFLLDVLKGVIPTLVAYFTFSGQTFNSSTFYISDFAIYLCGFFAIIGHIYPIYLSFKGGKGIATTIGVLVVCEAVHGFPWVIVAIMALVGAVLFIYLTQFGAMGSFIAITPTAICGAIRLYMTYGIDKDKTCSIMCAVSCMIILLICFFTWFAHRKNIERMLAGEEHLTSFKTMIIKHKLKKGQKEDKKQ